MAAPEVLHDDETFFHPVSRHRRRYTLYDFGDYKYDRYQIDSDWASGIRLGREAGTERWGHETGIVGLRRQRAWL